MKTVFYLVVIAVVFSGCRALNVNSESLLLENSKWRLVSVNQKPVDLGEKAFITFDSKAKRTAGKAACNSFFASYEHIQNNITFSGVGSTKMFCEGVMDIENQIITNLQKTNRFEIKSDILYLYSSNEQLLTFTR